MKGKKQRIWEWWYYFIKWSKMGFNASRMFFFQILYVPWIWTTKIWCSYAYFLHLIIIFNNLKSVCVTSENWNMDLKSQKLGFLARDKLRLSKKDIWCMFEHFFPLILPIFVGQTPKYSVVCFETDCARESRFNQFTLCHHTQPKSAVWMFRTIECAGERGPSSGDCSIMLSLTNRWGWIS